MTERAINYSPGSCPHCESRLDSPDHLHWCSRGPAARNREARAQPPAAWRSDRAFILAAHKAYPEELQRASRGGYDKGASQKLTYYYRGWLMRADADTDAHVQ